MPDTLRIGLLGPLQLRDGTGRAVHVGGRQLRVLLILLALDAGRVVPAGSLADAAGYNFADAAAAQLTELRSAVLTDRIEADLALGEGAV